MMWQIRDAKVVIKKAFEENSFTYKVDGKDNSVACISGEGFEYAQWGNLSDKDGILYGAMAIPKKTNNMRRRNVGLGGLDLSFLFLSWNQMH